MSDSPLLGIVAFLVAVVFPLVVMCQLQEILKAVRELKTPPPEVKKPDPAPPPPKPSPIQKEEPPRREVYRLP